jgi:hypothetical protein
VALAVVGMLAGLATPASAAGGTLTSLGWSASSTTTGATGVSYTYTFTTATTSTLTSVTMTVPAGTAGTAAVGTVTPTSVATGGSVTLASGTLTYTFTAVNTASSSLPPFTLYDTSSGTGVGQVTLGGSTATYPIGWWMNVPGNAHPGTYTSTVTLAVVSGP